MPEAVSERTHIEFIKWINGCFATISFSIMISSFIGINITNASEKYAFNIAMTFDLLLLLSSSFTLFVLKINEISKTNFIKNIFFMQCLIAFDVIILNVIVINIFAIFVSRETIVAASLFFIMLSIIFITSVFDIKKIGWVSAILIILYCSLSALLLINPLYSSNYSELINVIISFLFKMFS